MNIGILCQTIHIKHMCALENYMLMSFRTIINGNVFSSLKDPLKPNPIHFCLGLKFVSGVCILPRLKHREKPESLNFNRCWRNAQAQKELKRKTRDDEESHFVFDLNIVVMYTNLKDLPTDIYCYSYLFLNTI